MAKLNTTVDKIQLTTNMITSAAAASEWDTDMKYPSAAAVKNAIATAAGTAVCDIANAVGSVVITSTNSNPGSTLGGTWELIDKEFKNDFVNLSASDWTESNATFSVGKVKRDGHTIHLQLWLRTRDILTTFGGILGTLNRTACGLDTTKYEGSFVMGPENSAAFATTVNDQIDYVVKYFFRGDGYIELKRIMFTGNATSLPKESTICLEFSALVDWKGMLDSACDKFYWKRTA